MKDQQEAPACAGGLAPQQEWRDLPPPENTAAPEAPPPPALKCRVLQRVAAGVRALRAGGGR